MPFLFVLKMIDLQGAAGDDPPLNVTMESVTATHDGANSHPRFVPGQSRDRSRLVKYATAPPSRGRLPVTRKGRVQATDRNQKIAKDRFARTALAHELVSDINGEKHDAARRAHVKNMHEQRIKQAPHNRRGRNVPREYMEWDPTGGISAESQHIFTQEHLAFAIAREAAVAESNLPDEEVVMMGRQP